MSHETEKPGYPKPCDGPGIRADICVSDEYGNLKLAETVKIAGEGADLLRQAATGPKTVQLERAATRATADQALWSAIRNRTDAIAFDRYAEFINRLLCADPKTDRGTPVCEGPGRTRDMNADPRDPSASGLGAPQIADRKDALGQQPSIYGIDAYQLLKVATQAFLLFESGVVIKGQRDPFYGSFVVPSPNGGFEEQLDSHEVPGEASRLGRCVTFGELKQQLNIYLTTSFGRGLPYLGRIVDALVSLEQIDSTGNVSQKLPYCEPIMRHRFSCPSMLELIWSYWHEEGMLVQTTNAITLRFQNRRRGARDPLTNLELDPLFPVNNILWGFIQDEYSRLSVQRRAYEYDHHYGLTLYGKAIAHIDSADSRSKFISGFHNLLYRTAMFYREDDDATVRADAFTLLNALREVHIVLAEGAHNQFGDLPWTARAAMLIMQWMLARPEIRAFLRGRHMVPYQEAWMGAVDDMKRLQGWTDTTVTHFHELARFGEQIVLSVRYGDWIVVNDQEQARNGARAWRPEIQRYIHAYQVATGVDLAAEVVDARRADARYLQPSLHLRNRLAAQQPRRALPASPNRTRALPSMREGRITPRGRLLAPANRDDYE